MVNDNLMELLIMINACKIASAERVINYTLLNNMFLRVDYLLQNSLTTNIFDYFYPDLVLNTFRK